MNFLVFAKSSWGKNMKLIKFLIIDDELVDRAYYQRLLRQALDVPFECFEATCASEALTMLEKNPVDCILLDYQLPDRDGVSLIKQIRKLAGKYVPIIMLTGQGSENVAVNALKEGATDYIIKNKIEPAHLVNVLLVAIKNSQLKKIIYEQKKLLKNYSFYDRLTGLLSRYSFEMMAERALVDAKRFHSSLALLLIDLDNFMVINDSLGHLAGNALLIDVSKKISELVSNNTIIARLQNDRFVILVTGDNVENICQLLADKIIEKLSSPYQLSMDTATISTSIGIALYPTGGENVNDLLDKADSALLQAKEMGGCHCVFYKDSSLRPRP